VLPFDDAEYARRNKALLEAMRADDVDVLIITAPDTRCWLTGYTSRWYRAGASSRCRQRNAWWSRRTAATPT
jgi:Xaa-Pro aminopeptidase